MKNKTMYEAVYSYRGHVNSATVDAETLAGMIGYLVMKDGDAEACYRPVTGGDCRRVRICPQWLSDGTVAQYNVWHYGENIPDDVREKFADVVREINENLAD